MRELNLNVLDKLTNAQIRGVIQLTHICIKQLKGVDYASEDLSDLYQLLHELKRRVQRVELKNTAL